MGNKKIAGESFSEICLKKVGDVRVERVLHIKLDFTPSLPFFFWLIFYTNFVF